MKFLFYIFLLSSFTITAQNESVTVEEGLYGIQTGFFGIWINSEHRLADQWALRSDVGFDFGAFGGFLYESTQFLATPSFGLSPRWYYNLKKRSDKNRNIQNNSANFIALKATYNPDWFLLSNNDNVTVINQLSVIPKWAIKRTILDHFTYELGAGLGYRFSFDPDFPEGDVAADLHIRIGYTF